MTHAQYIVWTSYLFKGCKHLDDVGVGKLGVEPGLPVQLVLGDDVEQLWTIHLQGHLGTRESEVGFIRSLVINTHSN